MNINLSATLEQALKEQLAQKASEQWKAENKVAMERYNEFVEEHGNFSDEFRAF